MESDVIGHLVEVEHNASDLLDNAQKEAQHRIDKAKVSADAQYNAAYKDIIAKFEESYSVKTEAQKKVHSEEIKKYKKQIESLQKDEEGFSLLLDKLLVEA